VRDVASPDSEAQAADVQAVLEQIGGGPDSGRVVVEVWNKIDLLDEEERAVLAARALRAGVRAAPVSAVTGQGIDGLLALLAELVDQDQAVRAELAADDGKALAWLYRHGRIVERTEDAEGRTHLSVRLDPQALGRFERLFPGALAGHQ